MTEQDFLKYKSDFEVIKQLKGKIKKTEQSVRKLSAWDKNGSHRTALTGAMARLDGERKEFKDRLNGIGYNHMMLSLRKATVLYNKSKTKSRYITKFEAFNPFGVKEVVEIIAKSKDVISEKRTAVSSVKLIHLLRGFIRENYLTAQWEQYLKANQNK